MYRSPHSIGLPPLMVANMQLKAGNIQAAKITLRAAGYTWDDLVQARRSGALGAVDEPTVSAAPEPFRVALDEGSIYVYGNQVKVVPALLTALAVKVIMFSGKHAASRAKSAFRRKSTA